MGFAINTNNDALNTYRNLSNVQNSLSKSLERLSSGLRINTAGDDAAGLTISTKLGAQVSGLQQASRNAQDGLSLIQTADGALGQAQAILGRLRDLAVQAGNDTNSTDARTAINTEANSLKDELTRLSNAVNFNGRTLLNNTNTLTFQIGAGDQSDSRTTVNLVNLGTIANTLNSSATGTFTMGTPAAGNYTFKTGNTSVVVASTATTSTGLVKQLNEDGQFARLFTAKLSDDGSQLVVTSKTGGTVDTGNPGTGLTAGSATTPSISFLTQSGAVAALTAIDTAIDSVSTARAGFGALENRFDSAIATIATSVQNLTAAKSRITDVDMASEMVNYTRANVLSQSGTAMLAQANSLPQLALKLLG